MRHDSGFARSASSAAAPSAVKLSLPQLGITHAGGGW
jgi:hypothetical protein